MSNKIEEFANTYVDGVDCVVDAFNNTVPPKLAAKVGALAAFNPVTAPLVVPALVTSGILYGVYKTAKFVAGRDY